MNLYFTGPHKLGAIISMFLKMVDKLYSSNSWLINYKIIFA